MKSSRIMVMVFFLALLLWGATGPACSIDIIVDGAMVKLDTDPIEKKGVVFVPMRGIFERMGARVTFEKSTRLITAFKKGLTLKMAVGKPFAIINDKRERLLWPAFEKNCRTYVPLRFISEALGCRVGWHPPSKTVAISSKADGDPFEGITLDDKKAEAKKGNTLENIIFKKVETEAKKDEKFKKMQSIKPTIKKGVKPIITKKSPSTEPSPDDDDDNKDDLDKDDPPL
jgi:hypothetical protein